MAARTLRPRHQDEIRDKIQTTQLIKRLENHALDDSMELSSSRIKAIEILLRKSLPDLSAVEVTGANGGAIETVTLDATKLSNDALKEILNARQDADES
jgi:hypothetical protein